jgi:hypothetical protein
MSESTMVTDQNILAALAASLSPEEKRLIIAHIRGNRSSASWRLVRRLRFQLKARARANNQRRRLNVSEN